MTRYRKAIYDLELLYNFGKIGIIHLVKRIALTLLFLPYQLKDIRQKPILLVHCPDDIETVYLDAKLIDVDEEINDFLKTAFLYV